MIKVEIEVSIFFRRDEMIAYRSILLAIFSFIDETLAVAIQALQWGLFKFFRSGRTTSLLKELVKLTPIPKWQTRMLLCYRDIDF